jgi:hypothetical protein
MLPREERAVDRTASNGRLMWWVGLACLAYYGLILGGHHYSLDGILQFQSAKALVFRHTLVPDPPVLWMGAPQEGYWGLGAIVAYVPWLVLWSPLFAWRPSLTRVPYDPSVLTNPALYANLPYLLCSVVNPLVTAATAALVVAVGRRVGLSRSWSVAAALAYGLASPAATYARYDFSQPIAGLALTAGVWALLRWDEERAVGLAVVAGAAAGYAVLTRAEFLAVVPWLALWVFARARRQGLARAFLPAVIVGLIPMLAFALGVWAHRLNQGASALPPWSELVARVFPADPASPLVALAGHLVSPGRGLLLFFPLAWLAGPGLVRLARARPAPAALFGGVIGLLLALYSAFRVWWAGVSWGPRFLVPLLPLIVVAVAVWAEPAVSRRRRAATAGLVLLAAAGAVASWNGILVDINQYSVWVAGALGVVPDAGSTQFRLAASPLVSGWPVRPELPLDLFWPKLWHPARVPMLAELLTGARARLGIDVAACGPVLALGVPLGLLVAFGWAAWRLGRGLREETRPVPSGTD